MPSRAIGHQPDSEGGNGTDSSPSRYIQRISLRTGKEMPGRIRPQELLVESHRDRHPVDVAVQFLASRIVQLTGDDRAGWQRMRQINRAGRRLARLMGFLAGSSAVERGVQRLIGVPDTRCYFRFRPPTPLSDREVAARSERLRRAAREKLRRRGANPRLHILLTGATGFVGKEILAQAAGDRRIARMVCVLRPEKVRDPKTGAVIATRSVPQRGALLLKRLQIRGARAAKFHFVVGDIEKPGLGIGPAVAARLRSSLTHVIHAAASVSFDDPYEESYRANVLGSRHALDFSLRCQAARGSAFIAHIAIETSYIHGRTKPAIAQEAALAFPRNFYNNYYELTKAIASIETDRFMIERGLRVAQLLPSIIIGHSRTGDNRGDTKVVNAPVNAFGRAKEIVDKAGEHLAGKPKAWLLAQMAESFPGDPSAQLNLVPIDRVVAGIMAALTVPEAIGRSIHLATDDRIRSDAITRIAKEEIGVDVRLSDPTLFRTVTMPMRARALRTLHEPKLAAAVGKLAGIFSAYGEWGQPIHDVGNDVRILGLPIQRPHTEHAFRMLCRHNRYVQEFGKIRDPDEIARREAIWDEVIDRIEYRTGREVASIPAPVFRDMLARELDLKRFKLRAPSRRQRAAG
jgi:nucleoside-diphosphate-sugar epimerase